MKTKTTKRTRIQTTDDKKIKMTVRTRRKTRGGEKGGLKDEDKDKDDNGDGREEEEM